jgi:hypothetical protein
VHISPIFLGAVEEGIRIQLRTKVFRWVPELQGVFLAWKDIQILSPTAAVYGDVLPLIEVPVTVKALVWCPEKGGLIQGTLVHKGSDFIAARVLGLWNAVIVKSHCNYLDKSKVNEGDSIRFRIQDLQIVNNLLSIEGSLLSDDVGIVDANGNLYFPKVSGAEISVPSVISITNPKKRPRPAESALASFSSATTLPVSSPMPDTTALKKRKLKEADGSALASSSSPQSKKNNDKKEKEPSKLKW